MRKNYFWVQVELLSGKKRWYWVNKKLTVALNLEKKLNSSNYKKSLIGNYIIIPYSKYYFGFEHVTLGKVLDLQRSNHRTYNWYQTRSQFLTPSNIGTKLGYNYAKHDYNAVSRMHIFFSNYFWKKKLDHETIQKNRQSINK